MNIYAPGSKFFVSGKIGTWRKMFSEQLSAKFDEVIKKNLKYKGEIDYGCEAKTEISED